MQLRNQVILALKEVYDPEISINVYDLGLIYGIEVNDDHCEVTHTLTSMMCPFADQICEDIYNACMSVEAVNSCHRELVFFPPFGPHMIPEETRMVMGIDI